MTPAEQLAALKAKLRPLVEAVERWTNDYEYTDKQLARVADQVVDDIAPIVLSDEGETTTLKP